MKRIRYISRLCILLAAVLCLPAIAAAAGDPRELSPENWGNGLPFVTDQADILSGGEEAALAARAAELGGKYGCAVYIIIMDNYRKFTGGRSLETCGDDIREGYALGGGGDTVILLHSLKERDIGILAHGEFGNASFTDYGKDAVLDKMVGSLRKGDWYRAYEIYLEQCGRLLELSANGKPLDYTAAGMLLRNCVRAFTEPDWEAVLAALVTGVVLSLILTSIASVRLKSVRENTDARGYVAPGGVEITERSDRYTHTTTTVRDAPRRSGGRGGGGSRGGTTVNSRGSSFSGRKY